MVPQIIICGKGVCVSLRVFSDTEMVERGMVGGGKKDGVTYTAWKVDGGLSKLVEKQVRGDLHQEVSDKEDTDGGLILDRGKLEVSLEVGEFGGGDVISGWWCKCK